MRVGILSGIAVGPQSGPGDAPPNPPDAVSALNVVTAYSQTLDLLWNPAAGATEYKVFRGTSSPVDEGDTLVTTTGVTSFRDTGLTNGTTYYYVVVASNAGGDSDLSPEDFATPTYAWASFDPPTVTAQDAQVTVSWEPLPGSDSFDVLVSGQPDAVGVTSPYVYSGLTNGTTYTVDVRGHQGASTTTAGGVGRTPIAAPPASLDSTANGALTFTWPTSTGATSYDAYLGTAPAPTALLQAGTSSPRIVSGLDNNTTYYFRVRALNVGGDSGYGSEASGTPRVQPPSGLALTWSDQQVDASWDAEPNASGYDLFRSTTSPVTTGDTLIASNIATTSFSDTGRTNGTTYYYAVRAKDSGGSYDSALSGTVGETPLAAPGSPAASPGNGQITVSWAAVSGATAYDIFYSTTSPVTTSDTEISGVTSPHDITSLTNGTTYYARVRARNATGTTALSSEVSATPTAAAAEQFPATVAEWNTLSSAESIVLGDPSYIWLFDEASGSVVDEVAALSLAPTGTLEYQQTPTAFSGEFGVDITGETSDRFQGSTSDLQVTTGSFFAWIVVEFGAAPAAVATICEKFNSGVGHSLSINSSGHIELKLQDGTNTDTLTADFASHASATHLLGFGRDVAAGEAFLLTGSERITATLTATGSLSNTGPFRFGRFSSAPMLPIIYSAWWFGTEAEGVSETDWDNYAAHLGL